MRLSQSNLKLLATCPRKFQYLHLDQFPVPVGLEQLERMATGSQFHLLMQQYSLGLPITALLAADPQLHSWFEAFEQQRSQILLLAEHEQILWQQSEHLRTLAQPGHVLTVVYDWVMLGATQGQIIDWKTYPKPRKVQQLEQDWQTLLYLYVLAETTSLVPEQLIMTYWFFQARSGEAGVAQSARIRYSQARHEQTHAELQDMLSCLTQWLTDYETHHIDLPQVDIDKGHCQACAFASRCDRRPDQSSLDEATAFEAIAEVPI